LYYIDLKAQMTEFFIETSLDVGLNNFFIRDLIAIEGAIQQKI